MSDRLKVKLLCPYYKKQRWQLVKGHEVIAVTYPDVNKTRGEAAVYFETKFGIEVDPV